MNITILAADNQVVKGNVGLNWDFSNEIAQNIHAIQFNTETNTGHIEYNDGLPNEDINSLPSYAQALLDEFENQLPTPQDSDEYVITIDELREARNSLLADTDWTQLTDTQLSEEKKQEFVVYRQKLRDLTEGYTSTKRKDLVLPKRPVL